MQTQTTPGTAKSDYFKRRAEQVRQQLIDAEVLLIRRRNEAKWFTENGREIPKEFADRVAWSERRVKELRRAMQSALFAAGRI